MSDFIKLNSRIDEDVLLEPKMVTITIDMDKLIDNVLASSKVDVASVLGLELMDLLKVDNTISFIEELGKIN